MAQRHRHPNAEPGLISVPDAIAVPRHGGTPERARRLDDAVKRALDLILAALLLVLLLPLMEVIAVAIRLTSPGPALFRQARVGRQLTPFVMLKFRTMRTHNDDGIHRAYVTAMLTGQGASADTRGGIYKLTSDPRITPLGKLLRKMSLDELPQLLNVIRGHMSLVGPRPVLPWEAELFEPRHRIRFTVRPGITGLWQVNGRSTLSMRQALDLDLEYVMRRSLGLDLLTLVRTLPAVLRGHEAG
jgi:lipopolysaccharide/colanic/teichoic acid biosynthesis glycosyltransferase